MALLFLYQVRAIPSISRSMRLSMPSTREPSGTAWTSVEPYGAPDRARSCQSQPVRRFLSVHLSDFNLVLKKLSNWCGTLLDVFGVRKGAQHTTGITIRDIPSLDQAFPFATRSGPSPVFTLPEVVEEPSYRGCTDRCHPPPLRVIPVLPGRSHLLR
jgi:hypothetical protein